MTAILPQERAAGVQSRVAGRDDAGLHLERIEAVEHRGAVRTGVATVILEREAVGEKKVRAPARLSPAP